MNDPLDQLLSAHFKAPPADPLPGQDFSLRVLAALPPVRPRSRLAQLWDDTLDWETGLLAVGAALVVAFFHPFGPGIPGLDLLDQALTAFETWPAFSSLGLVLGLTVAVIFLFNDEEEEEISPGESAWF